jgi:hypothetical protein
MPIIVVGGHSRNVGKTSVAAGLIHAFRQYPWTAVKISSHRHAGVPAGIIGNAENACAVYEELRSDGTSDTCRYLAAGASRALWARIREDEPDEAIERLLNDLQPCPYLMIESNRTLRVLRPDLFIMVLRYDIPEFKESARRALPLADAVVEVNTGSLAARWEGVPEMPASIPRFVTPHPCEIPPGLIALIHSRFALDNRQ